MKAQKRIFVGLILCLLALTENVSGWEDEEATAKQMCQSTINYVAELLSNGGWEHIDEEINCPYPNIINDNIPNPIVNTTFTSFGQNPLFAAQIATLSDQIAETISNAITSAAFQTYNAAVATAALESIPIFGSIIASFQSLSINISSQTTTIENLLNDYGNVITSEIVNDIESAIMQNDITNCLSSYNADVQGWIDAISSINNLTETNLILSTLLSVLTPIEVAYQGFVDGPYSEYPYYTAQMLYINAIMHLNVLNMMALTCQIAYANQNQEGNSVTYYLQEAQTMNTSYINLLQQYSTNAVAYRLSFISSLQCDFGDSEGQYYNGSVFDLETLLSYYFTDNFVNQTISSEHDAEYEQYSNGNEMLCDEEQGQMGVATYNYIIAVQKGTAAFFDSFVSNFSSINSVQSQ